LILRLRGRTPIAISAATTRGGSPAAAWSCRRIGESSNVSAATRHAATNAASQWQTGSSGTDSGRSAVQSDKTAAKAEFAITLRKSPRDIRRSVE